MTDQEVGTIDRRPRPPRPRQSPEEKPGPPEASDTFRLNALEASSRSDPEPDVGSSSSAADQKASPVTSHAQRKQEDPDRPLTMSETFDMIRANLERVEGTRREVAVTLALILFGGVGVWALLTAAIPWSGGILQSVQDVLALSASWPTLPAPDDPRVAVSTDVRVAMWVGSPLVLGVFWFTAGYHLDRASRRAFRPVGPTGTRHSSTGYTLIAVAVVFPLILLGLVGSAWGVFALVSWAALRDAWGAIALLATLLGCFSGVVRLANEVLDRRVKR